MLLAVPFDPAAAPTPAWVAISEIRKTDLNQFQKIYFLGDIWDMVSLCWSARHVFVRHRGLSRRRGSRATVIFSRLIPVLARPDDWDNAGRPRSAKDAQATSHASRCLLGPQADTSNIVKLSARHITIVEHMYGGTRTRCGVRLNQEVTLV